MITSQIEDRKIGAVNYSLDMTIEEYYNIVEGCLNSNEYQRKRQTNSGSVYNLLKQDLIQGCVMPPIVLAVCEQNLQAHELEEYLKNSNNIKILDGLQRTYTIREIVNEYRRGDINLSYNHSNPLQNRIRVEVYVGINKLGILYRMLTLNAGQTRMTTRHQIEIIYSEYREGPMVTGVNLLTELDDSTPKELGEYKFRDVVEGFTSFLQKNFLTLDKKEILENIKDLERLAGVVNDKNLFYDFIDSYHHLVYRFNQMLPFIYNPDVLARDCDLRGMPFACSIIDLFNKSQCLTGFGCAMAELCEEYGYRSPRDLHSFIDTVSSSTIEMGFHLMLGHLDCIRRGAKKIGNDQREYFYLFFLNFYMKNSYCMLDFYASAKKAFDDYILRHNEKRNI